tara:strand:- start:9135 stop:9515 length:381 start_codon:yes stop_codon:yes gene_type:complete
MDVTEFIKLAFARGDVIGLAVAVLVLGVGAYLKMSPGLKSNPHEKSPAAAASRIDRLAAQVETVDQRLGRVESDLEHMPTNKDFHAMEMKFERMSGRMMSIERTTESTGRAVGRIEDFMLSMKRDK